MNGASASGRPTVHVLGPCRASRPGSADDGGLTAIQRRLLGRLALGAPREVSITELIDAVWAGLPPATARTALANQVSRLRKRFGTELIHTTAGGYVLAAPTDAELVNEEVAAAERLLSNGDHDASEAYTLADTALGRWRGTPLADLDGHVDVEAGRRRLTELRAAAENVRLEAAIRLGRVAWAIPEAERLVAENPLDEQRWVLLVRSLEAAGRRGDALGAVDRARTILRDRLGLSPGHALRAVYEQLLVVPEAPGSAAAGPLVGRTEELARTLDVVARGGAVVISGEGGVGKSRLLIALAAPLRAKGWTVAAAAGSTHASTAGEVLAELLSALGEQPDRVLGPIDGFVSALRRAADHAPVALLVDDLDLCGPSTLGAIEAAMDLDRVGVAASISGPGGAPDPLPAATRLDLLGLPADTVRRLAAERLGGLAGDDAVTGWLMEMSGGNPLFLECLLDDPAVVAQLRRGEPVVVIEDLARPSVLQDLVRRRLEPLSAPARAAMDVLAVLAPRAPEDLARGLSAPGALEEARATGLVHQQDGWAGLRHGAVRRVLYTDLPPGRRMELHHAVGQALAARSATATEVGNHLLAAADLDPLAAVRTARAAAREATARGAHRDAAQWSRRAFDVAAALGPEWAREAAAARIEEGDALRLAGDPSHEAVLLEAGALAQRIGDRELVGDAAFALLQLGGSSESGGVDQRAVAFAQEAIEQAADPEQRAVITAAASLAHSMAGSPERCRELFLEAEAAARSTETRRKVLPFAYLALGHPADLKRRDELTRELLATPADEDPVSRFEALHLAFSGALQRGRGPEVRAALGEMDRLVDRVGDVGRRWALSYQAAAVAHLDDDLDRAEHLSEQGLELFGPVSPSRALAAYSAHLLVIRLAQGRVAELAPATAALVEEQPGVPAWHAALALASAEHDPTRARRHAKAALREVAQDFTWLAAQVIGGRAAAMVSGRDVRRAYAHRLERWSHLVCWQGTLAYGPVATVLALLARADGDTRAQAQHTARALQLCRSLQAPVFERDLRELDLVP